MCLLKNYDAFELNMSHYSINLIWVRLDFVKYLGRAKYATKLPYGSQIKLHMVVCLRVFSISSIMPFCETS